MATASAETGHITGTIDKDYNLIWYTEACLKNALRLETYIQDAERAGDSELAEFFRKAQADSRKGARWASRCCARGSGPEFPGLPARDSRVAVPGWPRHWQPGIIQPIRSRLAARTGAGAVRVSGSG